MKGTDSHRARSRSFRSLVRAAGLGLFALPWLLLTSIETAASESQVFGNRSIEDSSFDAPPLSEGPTLAPSERHHAFTIARAKLSYRKRDGREFAGWDADLYLPQGHHGTEEHHDHTAGAQADGVAGSDGPAAQSAGSDRPRHPLIVVLPVGGFRRAVSASFARRFAKKGFAVVRLLRPPPEADTTVLRSLKGTARSLTEDTMNLRRVIDWASTLPGVDPERIGILGVSRGAIVAALVGQMEPRLRTVLVLGAADLAGVFRSSNLRVVRKMRAKELARLDGDLERAAARAAWLLRDVDPATRPGRLDPARTLLISARWDRVFHKQQALALREAAGGASQAWLPAGHYTSLLFARRVGKLALDHFKRTLG